MSLLKSTIENWFQKKKKEKQNSCAWLRRPLMRWDDVSTVVLLIDRELLCTDLPQEQLIKTLNKAGVFCRISSSNLSPDGPEQTARTSWHSLITAFYLSLNPPHKNGAITLSYLNTFFLMWQILTNRSHVLHVLKMRCKLFQHFTLGKWSFKGMDWQ